MILLALCGTSADWQRQGLCHVAIGSRLLLVLVPQQLLLILVPSGSDLLHCRWHQLIDDDGLFIAS